LPPLFVGIINYRQARSGQLTDRLTKAVEQLGSDNPQARMGAIFALEQIAADSSNRSTTSRHQSYVAAMLAALVRFQSNETLTPEGAALKFRVPDVQAALTVLCRPPVSRDHVQSDEKGRLDLSRSNLQRASLRDAGLQKADFSGSSLQGADLRRAKLQGAVLKDANLGRACKPLS
jgi:pentapeptide repeat protein